ncbi:PREDICTED: endoglucanase 14-like [Tarenaya hassleriana]|uniref:endoglucanase 14-like n=1 Tax=Tarenaya hassleriana TaxID=28532 RepID=UPI00053C7963|nr:PREDICTED: endoglucanase 14-like [Tarenaya hassleriana]
MALVGKNGWQSLFVSICMGMLLVMSRGIECAEYGEALSKIFLYFEAQRSGILPPGQRVEWRRDSALRDGSDSHVDLTGGYYDAGDNVKFGFPLAFTTTMLAWSSIEMASQLNANKENGNALDALKWATDYLIKAHPEPDVLYGQVGDGHSDHACWQRPEDMTTPRPSFRIDAQHPGSDLAAETAAAMAAASIAFSPDNPKYAEELLRHAKELFDFAKNHPGLYQDSIVNAGAFYASSGSDDEMLWAAAWLHRATGDQTYLSYLTDASNAGGTRSVFSWDDKFLGAQVLVAKVKPYSILYVYVKEKNEGKLAEYKSMAEQFICGCAQKGPNNIKKTPGGLLWFLPWNNLQYVATASFVSSVYAKYLDDAKTSINCPGGELKPSDLLDLTRSQMDYILGSNPNKMSYMVGFGSNYPKKPHHRGASIVSINKDASPVTCQGGFDQWFNNPSPNPNVLEGAVVGGPDENDAFTDSRSDYEHSEPAPVTVAPLVGALAAIA